MKILSLLSASYGFVAAIAAPGSPDPVPAGFEDWGYTDVRPGAHMFWWFYSSTNYDIPREQIPLVLWLQGALQYLLPNA
jgi:hypothetical protein